jgi:acyl-CoA synthetase (AMP-forming)/AMP-acid ligase II
MLLQMATDGLPDRVAIGSSDGGITMSELARRARRVAAYLGEHDAERLVLVDVNSEAVPIALFGAALACRPFVPINYRLTDEQLRAIVARTAPALVVVGDGMAERIGSVDGVDMISRKELITIADDRDAPESNMDGGDPDDIAVLLYTSGTTGEPKAAVLRHRNLASYILTAVEFAGAGDDEAAIVSVPPYHIAGVSSVLSSTYSGRRVVYLEQFDPEQWVRLVRDDVEPHPRRGRRERRRLAVAPQPVLRRRADARHRDHQGHGAAARRRFRERVRPDGDLEHDCAPRS